MNGHEGNRGRSAKLTALCLGAKTKKKNGGRKSMAKGGRDLAAKRKKEMARGVKLAQ